MCMTLDVCDSRARAEVVKERCMDNNAAPERQKHTTEQHIIVDCTHIDTQLNIIITYATDNTTC